MQAAEYQERLEFATTLALETGRLTLDGFGRSHQIAKDGPDGYDIATEYDLRAEALISSRIQQQFGEPVLGEEAGLSGGPRVASHRLWIVDPIDGTFNYQRGLPLYAISIAFCEESVPVCAAIALPALDQLFFATKGSGAFVLQGGSSRPQPIHVGQEKEMARLVISLAGASTYELLAACAAKGIPWRSLRVLLGAVASLAFLAWGRLDAFVDGSLKLWDCAAGDLLVQEAGGPPLVDQHGAPIFPGYVQRWLEGGDPGGFTCVAASSPDLFRDPLQQILEDAAKRMQR